MPRKKLIFLSIKISIFQNLSFFLCVVIKWNDLHACLWAFNLYCFYSFWDKKSKDYGKIVIFQLDFCTIMYPFCVYLYFYATILIHSNKTYFSLSFVINKPHPTNTFFKSFKLLFYLCLCISCKFKACFM